MCNTHPSTACCPDFPKALREIEHQCIQKISDYSSTTSTKKYQMKLSKFVPMGLLVAILAGCDSAPRVISEADVKTPRPYERGTTDYRAGQANVRQPDIYQTPDRTFDGFRVAGPDSDLVVGYWDALLEKFRAERAPNSRIFEVFRSRHRDLEVYQTQAANAVLREFRKWVKSRNLERAFETYWSE